MFSEEQRFLLMCLSDLCRGRKTEKPDHPLNYEVLYQYAQTQSLAGIVYEQCRHWLPQATDPTDFRKSTIDSICLSVNRIALFEEVVREFERQDIPFACMKGSCMRDMYPVPELRTMGDIDLVIPSEKREVSDRIMTDILGYAKYVDNHSVWTYSLGIYEYEIHDHMFYEELANHVDYIGYFDHIWDHVHPGVVFGIRSGSLFIPDAEYHFLYLITHLAKHIINKGSGFRSFLDLVMIIQKNPEMDWEWIKSELQNLELLSFTETCMALCEEWFHVVLPLAHKPLDTAFLEEITQKIFRDGTFGLKNDENEGISSAKEIKRYNENYHRSAVRVMWKRLFPSYHDMRLIPWYSFVDARPWLLPAAWVYRWIYSLVHHARHAFRRLLEPLLLKKKIEKRESYIKDWGL